MTQTREMSKMKGCKVKLKLNHKKIKKGETIMLTMRKQIVYVIFALTLIAAFALVPMGVFASTDDQDRISIATSEAIYISWPGATADTGTAVNWDPNSSYYPATFMFYVSDGTTPVLKNASTDAVIPNSVVYLPDYSDQYADAYEITLPTGAASYLTMTLSNADDNGGVYYVNFSAPNGSLPTGSILPTDVNGYLPLGQFATGAGWGSIYSNGTNKTGTTKKFLNGYSYPGVSLGAAGGYIQFEYDDTEDENNNPIAGGFTDDPKNPYGIDFIVYGNPFNGNPEAGSVMVATRKYDTTLERFVPDKWYELAGSLYYENFGTFNITNANNSSKYSAVYTGTDRNTEVEYKLGSSNIQVRFDNHGVSPYFYPFTNAPAWWPLHNSSTENYGAVSGIGTGTINSDPAVQTVYNSSDTAGAVIKHSGITVVEDSNTTDFYSFGYADVRQNGSNYGTAINPYATLPSAASGGDGFDLAWAVDPSTKEPVDLSNTRIYFVRVYSSVLDNGTFGETSAEVCGIYTTGNQANSDVGTTATPTVKFGTKPNSMSTQTVSNGGVTPITTNSSTFYVSATSSAANIYINNQKVTSGTKVQFTGMNPGDTRYVRVIVQDSNARPYITTLKVTR